MGSLLDIQQNTDTSVDFLESTKSDLFSDEVFVFTPGWKNYSATFKSNSS